MLRWPLQVQSSQGNCRVAKSIVKLLIQGVFRLFFLDFLHPHTQPEYENMEIFDLDDAATFTLL